MKVVITVVSKKIVVAVENDENSNRSDKFKKW